MQCPLCGLAFSSWESNSVCTRCPLACGRAPGGSRHFLASKDGAGSVDCHLTRCPRCGYEWAEESRLVNWLQRRLHRWRAARHEHAGGRR